MRRLAVILALLLLIIFEAKAVSSRVGAVHEAAPKHKQTAVRLPRVSLASVFAPHSASLTGLDASKLIALVATGDVIPARMVNDEMTARDDFTYPFLKTYRYTRAANLTLINLESPLIYQCPVTEQTMTFCGDPRSVQGLKLAGVDIANLPNNHIGNYGLEGIHATERLLTANHVAWDGFSHTVYKQVKGVVFAFLGFNGVGQQIDTAEIAREIGGARRRAAVVVVSFHWGKEYTPVPLTAPGVADQDPRMIAHLAVNAGANLIIGNHPHQIQGVEIYRGTFISYASGNFVFDQLSLGNPRTQEGVVGTYTFDGPRLVSVRYRPVVIDDYAQPHFLSAKREAVILARMRAASLLIEKGY
jgi:poly-gamma-glutamate capsule biosynthesis protein CapA/YwtB (metallophosphatase superfamily)